MRTCLPTAAFAVLAVTVTGCGTLMNLHDPVAPPAAPVDEPGAPVCKPFGGVQRSVVYGGMLMQSGRMGFGAGAIYLAVDTPLSLVGDVVTLPVVYARQHGLFDGAHHHDGLHGAAPLPPIRTGPPTGPTPCPPALNTPPAYPGAVSQPITPQFTSATSPPGVTTK